jgi:O-antigen ligase
MIATNKHINGLFIAGMLLEGVIMYLTMAHQKGLVSTLFLFTFIWILYFFARYNYSKEDKSFRQVVFFTIILSILNVILTGGINDFNYYKKVIMFVCFLMFLYLSSIYSINRQQVKWLILINFVVSLFYIRFYNTAYIMTDEGYVLTLGFSNPNQTGMFLLNSILYCSIPIAAYRDVRVRWYYLVPFVWVAFSISPYLYFTESRSCIAAFAVFIILVLLDYIMPRFRITSKAMLYFLTMFPLVFAVVYLVDYSLFANADLSFGFGHGKHSGTRLEIWSFAFNKFFENPILGNYYGISNGTGSSQMHNTHVDVLASYGVVPFLLFVNVLYKALKNFTNKQECRFNRVAFYAFIACLISGTFEASLVAGGMGLHILSCGFILLANANIEGNSNITTVISKRL